jgi:carboxylesterase type B
MRPIRYGLSCWLTMLGAVVGCVWQAQQCRGNSTVKADFRPVLSSILNDYMFRCPSWRAAHLLQEKSRPGVPVYVYQFSHPTRVGASPYIIPKHMGQGKSLVHRESLSDYRLHAAAHTLVDKSGVLWIDSNVMTLWLPQVPGYPECHGLSCHTSELPYVFNNLEIISKSYAMATEAKNVSLVRSK